MTLEETLELVLKVLAEELLEKSREIISIDTGYVRNKIFCLHKYNQWLRRMELL